MIKQTYLRLWMRLKCIAWAGLLLITIACGGSVPEYVRTEQVVEQVEVTRVVKETPASLCNVAFGTNVNQVTLGQELVYTVSKLEERIACQMPPGTIEIESDVKLEPLFSPAQSSEVSSGKYLFKILIEPSEYGQEPRKEYRFTVQEDVMGAMIIGRYQDPLLQVDNNKWVRAITTVYPRSEIVQTDDLELKYLIRPDEENPASYQHVITIRNSSAFELRGVTVRIQAPMDNDSARNILTSNIEVRASNLGSVNIDEPGSKLIWTEAESSPTFVNKYYYGLLPDTLEIVTRLKPECDNGCNVETYMFSEHFPIGDIPSEELITIYFITVLLTPE